jgi:hypothetical protein
MSMREMTVSKSLEAQPTTKDVAWREAQGTVAAINDRLAAS